MKTKTTGWIPAITGKLAASATAIARTVATRLSTPECLEKAVAEAPQQSAFPNKVCWIPHTLFQGHAGLALLCGYADACFPEEEWDLKGRQQLQIATEAAEGLSGPSLGISSGLSGLGFAALELSRRGRRYRRLLTSLDEAICFRTIAAAKGLHGRHGLSFSEFDAISGLSGVGAYLLCRRDEPRMATALSSVIEAFAELLSKAEGLPPWYTPPHLLGDEKTRQYCPHGYLNLGLAHGIPAPLALLSLAHTAGISVPGLAEAIECTAGWLCETRCDDAWGINWPTVLPLVETGSTNGQRLRPIDATSALDGPSRSAWCYGSPGVARALWLAGAALDRQEYRNIAISAMEAVFRRPIQVRRIDSPTFCHGVAGLLAIALRFFHDTEGGGFSKDISALVEQLLDSYQPESTLGFRHLETGTNEMDQPGLLEGAPGVALALLASATNAEPTWDRLFLLS